jgi:hypothetical protein
VIEMKRFVIIGSLLSCILLLLTPQLSAVQYTLVTETQQEMLQQQISNDSLLSLLPTQQQQALGTRFYEILTGDFTTTQINNPRQLLQDDPGNDDPPQPMFITFLGILYVLIAYLIIKIIGILLRNAVFLITGFIGKVVTLVQGIITVIISLISFLFNLIYTIFVNTGNFFVSAVQTLISIISATLLGIFNVLANTGEFILNGIVLILSGIISMILSIFTGLYRLFERLWIRFGTFLGVVLEFLKIIYDTLFPFATAA